MKYVVFGLGISGKGAQELLEKKRTRTYSCR